MSFRKRSEVIGNGMNGPAPVRGAPMPNRGGPTPGAIQGTGSMPSFIAGRVPGRLPARGPPPTNTALRTGVIPPHQAPQNQQQQQHQQQQQQEPTVLSQHPGIKPSILTSQPTVSTGSFDLDKILGHQGLPLGCSLLIEENGTTDFATILAKKYAVEGVIQNRLDTPNTHVIVLGADSNWGKSLPGIYKGSSREQKKLKVLENESKLSVSNLNDPGQQKQQQQNDNNKKQARDLKIAWRYGFLDKERMTQDVEKTLSTAPDFIHQYDITTTLMPAPNPTEISYVPLSSRPHVMVKQIESIIANKHKDKLIRIVIPNILHPLLYTLELSTSMYILQLSNHLRMLTRKYAKQLTVLGFINLDLYPRDTALVTMLEKQFDTIVELKPFDPNLYELMERVYAKEPKKIKHGFLNIIKLPALSDLGMMLRKDMEYCFKNSKKNFDIEEWSIPVDEETGVDKSEDHSHVGHGHAHGDTHSVEIGGDGNPLKGQTRKDIDF